MAWQRARHGLQTDAMWWSDSMAELQTLVADEALLTALVVSTDVFRDTERQLRELEARIERTART
jgi:tRNA(Phe) wybutosine-synthesizing methylase Tyw3